MPTKEKTLKQEPTPIKPTLSLKDLAVVLIKHYDLTEGVFDLMVEYQIGIGAVGPDKSSLVPGAMIGVSRIGLMPTTMSGINTVDASTVNPKKKSRKKVDS
jgi:hypothetical protein